MYSSLSTRRRILLALLVLGGKSTYSAIKSFLPIGYSGPKFYGMLKRLEKEGLIKRSPARHQAPGTRHHLLRLLPAGLELLERRYGPRIRRLTDKDYKSYKVYNNYPWSLVILNFPTDQAYSRSRLADRARLRLSPRRRLRQPLSDSVRRRRVGRRKSLSGASFTRNHQPSTINHQPFFDSMGFGRLVPPLPFSSRPPHHC